MKCTYACNSPEHTLARRHFLGNLAVGCGAFAGFGAFVQPAAAGQLASKQKRVLSIFLSGGSSQLETWDPKPKTDTGGPFRAIPTSVPGIHVSELLPLTAQQMHRMALIRSINTNENDHGLGRYLMETYHELGCTGCGRCARSCLVDISPVDVFNELHGCRVQGE